jgi:hypothetical protein
VVVVVANYKKKIIIIFECERNTDEHKNLGESGGSGSKLKKKNLFLMRTKER